MDGAPIGIGSRSDALAQLATAAAVRIGPVEVDHGETACKTPDAVTYIAKARAHRARQEAKKPAPARPASKPAANKPASKPAANKPASKPATKRPAAAR